MRLYENTSARSFEDAHLLGNGRLGATIYGGVPFEEILINDDTLWSGSESYRVNEGYYDNLKRAQALALSGDVKQANNIINDEMEGTWGEAYMPLASAHICVGQKNDRRNMKLKHVISPDAALIKDYSRVLDLDDAVETVEYRLGDALYRREYFVSYDRQLIYARFSAEGGPLDLAASMDSKLKHSVRVSDGAVTLRGIAPDHAEPSYTPVQPPLVYLDESESNALRFAAQMRVIDTDGKVFTDRTRIYVNDASYAVIAIAAGTNYAGYMQPRDRDVNRVVDRLADEFTAAGHWDDALRAHIAGYQALMGA